MGAVQPEWVERSLFQRPAPLQVLAVQMSGEVSAVLVQAHIRDILPNAETDKATWDRRLFGRVGSSRQTMQDLSDG